MPGGTLLRAFERVGGMALGLLSRQARAHVLLRFQVLLGPRYRRLRRVQIRRIGIRRAGRAGGRDRLPGIAHFLHGRPARATQEANDTNNDGNEAQHNGHGH